MKEDARLDNPMTLPHLAEIFEALRRGKHLSIRDGEWFQALKEHEPVYKALFAKLGFQLIRHARDFFYFFDTSNFTDLARKMAVFMFILVESLADRGEAVEETVMTRRFVFSDLPHLHGERYQQTMREAGVTTPEEVAAIVRTMERFGFARGTHSESFCFDTPAYRFLDLCMEMAAKAATAAVPDTGTSGEMEVAPG